MMDRPLIGRQPEQDLLRYAWRKASDGQTTVAAISGEPGIGKTALLNRIAITLEQEGALILRGLASAMEGMPPYLPFLEALGHYILTAPLAQLNEQLGAYTPTLVSIFPEITHRLGAHSAAQTLPAEQARFRLFEAVALFLSNICQHQPVLLLFDDLQWADAASFDLLTYIVLHQPRIPLLILAGVRRGEDTWAEFQQMLAELERLRSLTLIELGPLSANEMVWLAEHYLGAPLDAQSNQVLLACSEGNPFFAEELLRNWQEMGRLSNTSIGWRLEIQAEEEFPASIMRAIEQRLMRLSIPTIEILRSAAIIGRYFEIALLAEVMGQEAEIVEANLSSALQANLIYSYPGGLAFNHELIREALYQQVPAARRQRLHGFIGRALEMISKTPDTQQLTSLAFHFTRSGDRERGIRYARLAAEQALRAYAPKEAMRHYQSASVLLAQMEQMGNAVPFQRGELLLGLGNAALHADMKQDALLAFESALTWFMQNGDPFSAARAAYGLGRARWQVEEISAAQQAFEHALELLGERDSAETAHIHADLANLLVLSRHRYEEGMAHAQRGLEIARQLNDEHLMATALRALGNLFVRTNRLAEGIAHLEKALALAEQSDDYLEAAEISTGLLIAFGWNCNFSEILATGMQLIDYAERCQARHYTRHVYSLLFLLKIVQGDLAGSSEWLERAEETTASLASPEPWAFLHYVKAMAAYYSGDYEEMAAQTMEAIEILRTSDPEALFWYLGIGALANLLSGRHSEGCALRDELEARLQASRPETFPAAEAFNHLALFALASGERDRLLDLYPNLLPFRGQFHDSFVDWLLGTIEILRGDWKAAESYLNLAESITRRENLRWELAQTLAARADLELARGGAGSVMRARVFLAEALEIFKSYGNKPQIKRFRAWLRDLPPQPGERQLHPAPAGLSRRELNVLQLLAQGRSNREIAETLALSEKTIANHVTMIFNKIGVENRAAAAAFAAKAGVI